MKKYGAYAVLFFFIGALSFFTVLEILPKVEIKSASQTYTIWPLNDILAKVDSCTRNNYKKQQKKCEKLVKELLQTIKRGQNYDFDSINKDFFNIYLKDDYILYIRPICKTKDMKVPLFSLNFWPNNPKILAKNRRKFGFGSRDFLFHNEGYQLGGKCLALKRITGAGGFKRIVTGQFVKKVGYTWKFDYKNK